MKYLVQVYFLTLFFLPRTFYGFAYPYEKIELVRILERNPHSLEISRYLPMNSKNDRLFAPFYWKVYYQKDRIVGEELFEKGQLSYYYVYFYDQNKVYQKGFFWYGIRRDIVSVKLGDQRIKQGFIYKNIPDTYRVYDAKTKKQLYAYNYPRKEI